MKYVGIQTQIDRNNRMSILLLLLFPCILLGMVYVFIAVVSYLNGGYYDNAGEWVSEISWNEVNMYFLGALPWVVIGVGIWFTIAYFANTSIIANATNARPLERRENPRVYNIVENLCMTCGMDMPQINIVHDDMLNAFASGINKKTYTVTVTTGLLNLLNDDELAGVIGHELTHIRNRDTRLLITSIIFVGIVSTIMSLVVRMLFNHMMFGGSSRDNKRNGAGAVVIMLVGLVCCVIAYFFTLAGGAELCGNPLALASALKKISGAPGLQDVKREDVAQLFIIKPHAFSGGIQGFFNSMFATHPDTAKRIQVLEQF